MVISCSTTYFLEVGVYISSKVATKGFFEVKNIESSTFLRLLIKKGGVQPKHFMFFWYFWNAYALLKIEYKRFIESSYLWSFKRYKDLKS